MQITRIEAQTRSPERVNIHVDGAFRFALAREAAYREGLAAGNEISASEIERLERDDTLWKARERALNLLSFRARTSVEIGRRLRDKGFDGEVVDACVEELTARGLLDDTAYAESFVRDRVRFRPSGSRRLAQELRAKGVERETASAAIEEVLSGENGSELELARAAVRKWKLRPGEDPARARRRLYGFLARRGFSSETVRALMEETSFTS